MAHDATTEKIRDKNKIRTGQTRSFMSKEAPGGGRSRQQNMRIIIMVYHDAYITIQ